MPYFLGLIADIAALNFSGIISPLKAMVEVSFFTIKLTFSVGMGSTVVEARD